MNVHYLDELNDEIKEALPFIVGEVLRLSGNERSNYLCEKCSDESFTISYSETGVCFNCEKENDVCNPHMIEILNRYYKGDHSFLLFDFLGSYVQRNNLDGIKKSN